MMEDQEIVELVARVVTTMRVWHRRKLATGVDNAHLDFAIDSLRYIDSPDIHGKLDQLESQQAQLDALDFEPLRPALLEAVERGQLSIRRLLSIDEMMSASGLGRVLEVVQDGVSRVPIGRSSRG
ncbi:hypothetical protein AB0E96_00035 [Kitasatospora sp. NPDC036755]|uniref:hypothetical protein n=1 Tax=Kitasatospora sp. NPDC036755 TaxID=3154600 RepID=UPI0033FE7556